MEEQSRNLAQLEDFCQGERRNISTEDYFKLVENDNKRLIEAISSKGHTIDY